MSRRWFSFAEAIGFTLLLGLIPAGEAAAQYQVFVWENFESGDFPDSLTRMHSGSSRSVSPVDFTTAPELPAGILDGAARQECGRMGLRFSTSGKEVILSAVSGLALDRQRLGATGRALYQADFWVPAAGSGTPNIAVLAMAHGEGTAKEQWKAYRFGLSGGGQRIFFTYIAGGKEPLIKKEEPAETVIATRPGWHRFQLIFEGQDKIICAIDGKPTSFSPIVDASMQSLRAGIMVASMPGGSGVCYADNLSIQWSPDEVPLPDSPWVTRGTGAPDQPLRTDPGPVGGAAAGAPAGAQGAGAIAGAATTAGGTASLAPGAALGGGPAGEPGRLLPAVVAPVGGAGPVWIASPEEAWRRCVAENKPVLLLLYAPRAAAYRQLHEQLRADPSSAAMINRFVPLAVDVNQLSGGVLAQKFNVFRVPCFIVFTPDSREKVRLILDRETPWAAISQFLQTAAQ